MSTAAIVAGTAAASIAGGAIAAHGATKAANTQATAAEQAAQLQHQDAQAAQAFTEKTYNDYQTQQAPFIASGQNNLATLNSLMPSLTAAPTDLQMDPGFAFRQAEGAKLIQRSAAARGNLLTGGTAKALDRYGQDYASNEYGAAYARARGVQDSTFNKYSTLAGLGQQATANEGAVGSQTASNVGNILLTSGAQQGQQLNNAAAARASGYIGGANAYGGALSNIGGLPMQLLLLRQLYGGAIPGSSGIGSGSPFGSPGYTGGFGIGSGVTGPG